jgi:hypothetical protein
MAQCPPNRRLAHLILTLPGNWESSKFNLPASLVEAIPQTAQ